MELSTRRVQFAGCTTNSEDVWMMQVGRNLTDSEEGFMRNKSFFLMDSDRKHAKSFRTILNKFNIAPVQLPPKSPNLNAHIERFMRLLKEECLERLILFGEESLRNAVAEYLIHFHTERNHQGLQNPLLQPDAEANKSRGENERCDRLDGMLRFYYRNAA